jgi:hypothetical protein
MSESYSEKLVRITITFDEGGENGSQMIFMQHAMNMRITKQGAPELPKAQIEIYGLSMDQMMQLTMLSFDALSLRRNVIEIAAGDSASNLAVVFQGEIMNSAPDMNKAPSPVMQIEAITAAYPQLLPTAPVAVKGEQPAESLGQSFAQQSGLSFVNCGMQGSLKNCVINGDPMNKARWLANTMGMDLVIDDKEMVFVAPDKARGETVAVDVIDPASGEIGYPSFDSMGIQATCFFNPNLRVAGLCRIKSSMPRASGVWKIYSVTHDLAVNMPSGGAWRTTIAGTWMDS